MKSDSVKMKLKTSSRKPTFAGINNLKNSFNLLLSVDLADLLEPDRELSSKI